MYKNNDIAIIVLMYIIIMLWGVMIGVALSGCALTYQNVVPSEIDVNQHSDPVEVIITGNPTIQVPSGSYTISDNRIIVN